MISNFLILFFTIFVAIIQYCNADVIRYKKIKDVIIYKEKGLYSCFPNLFLDDSLLVVGVSTRITNSHYDKKGGGKRFISNDGGLSWIETKKLNIYPGYKNKNGIYIITVPKNWQEIKYNEVEKIESSNIVIKKSNNKLWKATGIFQKILDSNGNLINSYSLSIPDHALLMGTNLSSYLSRSDGLRIIALFGKINSFQKENQIFLLHSIDEGFSWQFIKPYDYNLSFNEIGLGETALVEMGIDSILGVSRGSDGFLYSFLSFNKGLNWTLPKKLPINGYPANLLNIGNNQILCTYGYRKNPIGIRALILNKNTLNITSEEFIIRDDGYGNPFDSGYPMTIQLKDNSFFSCYYITKSDNITHVAGTKWLLE